MKRITILVVVAEWHFAFLTTGSAAPSSPDIQPICGVPGYTLQKGYRFGKSAELLPGETAVQGTADMVALGWKNDQPWGRINFELQYFVDCHKPETNLGPNHVFEADDFALVAAQAAMFSQVKSANSTDFFFWLGWSPRRCAG